MNVLGIHVCMDEVNAFLACYPFLWNGLVWLQLNVARWLS